MSSQLGAALREARAALKPIASRLSLCDSSSAQVGDRAGGPQPSTSASAASGSDESADDVTASSGPATRTLCSIASPTVTVQQPQQSMTSAALHALHAARASLRPTTVCTQERDGTMSFERLSLRSGEFQVVAERVPSTACYIARSVRSQFMLTRAQGQHAAAKAATNEPVPLRAIVTSMTGRQFHIVIDANEPVLHIKKQLAVLDPMFDIANNRLRLTLERRVCSAMLEVEEMSGAAASSSSAADDEDTVREWSGNLDDNLPLCMQQMTASGTEGDEARLAVLIDEAAAGDWISSISSDCGGALTAEFRQPLGIASDAARDCCIVSDSENHRVVCLSRSSRQLVWQHGCTGQRGLGDDHLNSPRSCALSGDSTAVFIADSGNNRIVVLDASTGAFLYATNSEDGADFDLNQPSGLTIQRGDDSDDGVATDLLWVADTCNHRVLCFETGRVFPWRLCLQLLQGDGHIDNFRYPRSIAVAQSHVFVCTPMAHRVQVFRADTGAYVQSILTRFPRNICASDDTLYLTDSLKGVVRAYSVETFAEIGRLGGRKPRPHRGVGGTAAAAAMAGDACQETALTMPSAVCYDASAHEVLVTCSLYNRVHAYRALERETSA